MTDDKLREQVAKAVCSERVETVMDIIREHTAKAELRADARARVDEIKERSRAEKAEAATERALAVWRKHTDSHKPAPSACICLACEMGRALDGTEATDD